MPDWLHFGTRTQRVVRAGDDFRRLMMLASTALLMSGCSTSAVPPTSLATTSSISTSQARSSLGPAQKSSLSIGATAAPAKSADPAACRQHAEAIATEIVRVSQLPLAMRTEAEQAPNTLSTLLQRSAEPLLGLSAHRDYVASRTRLQAQARQLTEVGCPAIDLDQRLATSDAAIASGLWRYGTEAEAKAMLNTVFTDVAADRDKALRRMRAGWEPFKSRDIRANCADRGHGTILTSKSGTDQLEALKDAGGKDLGFAIRTAASGATAAAPKNVTFSDYLPGRSALGTRTAFIAQNDSLICWTSAYR